MNEALEAFFLEDGFLEGVLLQTRACLQATEYTLGYKDWWAVDLFEGTYHLVFLPKIGTYKKRGTVFALVALEEEAYQLLRKEGEPLDILVPLLREHQEMLETIKETMRKQQ